MTQYDDSGVVAFLLTREGPAKQRRGTIGFEVPGTDSQGFDPLPVLVSSQVSTSFAVGVHDGRGLEPFDTVPEAGKVESAQEVAREIRRTLPGVVDSHQPVLGSRC